MLFKVYKFIYSHTMRYYVFSTYAWTYVHAVYIYLDIKGGFISGRGSRVRCLEACSESSAAQNLDLEHTFPTLDQNPIASAKPLIRRNLQLPKPLQPSLHTSPRGLAEHLFGLLVTCRVAFRRRQLPLRRPAGHVGTWWGSGQHWHQKGGSGMCTRRAPQGFFVHTATYTCT